MAATKQAAIAKGRTREDITKALLGLLENKSLGELSVTEVCKRAGVSRMAFYRNFESTDEVLYRYFQPILHEDFRLIKVEPSFEKRLQIQKKFFATNGSLFKNAERRGYEHILRKITMDEISIFFGGIEDEYLVAFMAGGTYEVWEKWLCDDCQTPLVEILRMLKRFGDTAADAPPARG